MTKLNKNQRAAVLAKELGYTHISTIVKQVFTTTYHNVQDVDYVIERGWVGAPKSCRFKGLVGTISSELPAKTIARPKLFKLLEEKEAQKYCTADFDVDSCNTCGECDD